MLTVIVEHPDIAVHLGLSALARRASAVYGDFVVFSSFPDVFYNVQGIKRSFPLNHPRGYEDFVRDQKYVIWLNPYREFQMFRGEMHLYQAIAQQLRLDAEIIQGEPPRPQMPHIDDKIVGEVEKLISKYPEFVVFQPSAGRSDGVERDWPEHYAIEFSRKFQLYYHKRNIALVVLFPTKKGNLEGCLNLHQIPRLALPLLLKHALTFVGVDASLNYFSNMEGVRKPGIVLWGATHPDVFGFAQNINHTGQCEKYKTVRPYPLPTSDFREDGSKWISREPFCMNIQPDRIFTHLFTILSQND